MQRGPGVRGHVRALRRLTGVMAVGLWAAGEAWYGCVVGWTVRQRAAWLQRTCRRVLRVLGVSVRREGRAPVDAWWTPNHISYLDILVLAASAPVTFVAKAEVRRWPAIGWFAARAGTRFFDRQRVRAAQRLGAEMLAEHEAGVAVAVFLEGTTSPGAGVLPFRPAFLDTALASGRPVVPVALDYETSVDARAGEHVGWWGEATLLPHLWRLAAIERVAARVVFGEAEDTAGVDRKRLAQRLRERVISLRAAEGARSPARVR